MSDQSKGKEPQRPDDTGGPTTPLLKRQSTEPVARSASPQTTSPFLTPPSYWPQDLDRPPFRPEPNDTISLNQAVQPAKQHHSRIHEHFEEPDPFVVPDPFGPGESQGQPPHAMDKTQAHPEASSSSEVTYPSADVSIERMTC